MAANIKIALAVVLVIAAGLWWADTAAKNTKRSEERASRQQAQRSQGAELKKAITLPNGDGTVYVIESAADDFGFEVHTCMLHVKQATSAMGCTPAKMRPLDDAE
jgi:hypothetical protein